MRIQKKSRVLALILAFVMLLSACSGNTPTAPGTEPNVSPGTEAPPVSAPVEEPSDVPLSEETSAPSEEVSAPSEKAPASSEEPPAPSEEIPRFYEANGLSYPSALGKPVLGEGAAALVSSVAQSEASKQITNVGDAIWYLQSAEKFDQPYDTCNLFAALIAGDYDEVGFIRLTCPGNGESLVYVLQDGIYYLLEPFALARGNSGWFCGHGRACTEGEDLDVICEEAMATWPDGGADQSKRSYSVDKRYSRPRLTEQEEELFAYLTTPQYTREQIDQWVAEGLTLEQWAEKIRVPADAIQMLEALGYRSMLYDDNVVFGGPNGTRWGGIWNAQTVFAYRSGRCGGTSNLMNFLLSGDFDEQGYVEYCANYGGHIFNYFLSDGIYVMCDFVDIFAEKRMYIDEGTDAYVVFIGGDLHEFTEKYLEIKGHNDPEDTQYIYQLFMYSRDGTKLARGSDENSYRTKLNYENTDLLPQQYQDSYTILFEREGHPIRFVPISDPETWPAAIRTETNAPADTGESSHFYTLNGLFFPSELGEPVLGEAVANLSPSSAAEQINNVGDAIYYLQSVGPFDPSFDTCRFFAELLEGDYDEVGLIRLRRPGNMRSLIYIRLGETFYPFSPDHLANGFPGWFNYPGSECIRVADLDILCEKLLENNPDHMTSWETEILSTRSDP